MPRPEEFAPVPVWQLRIAGDWADYLDDQAAEQIKFPEAVVLSRKRCKDLIAFLRALGLPHDAVFEMELRQDG